MKHPYSKCLAVIFGLCFVSSATAEDYDWYSGHWMRESVEISNHVIFSTADVVDGATILIRDFTQRVVTATIFSKALEPNWAYSIWWAVFNYPRYCIEPLRCSVRDLEINGGDPRVKASVFWAGGLVADESGNATTELRLRPGRTGRELFAMSQNWGLQNFRNAEIHVVLRSHGEAGVWDSIAQQIGTANQACPPQGCINEFASFHPAR